MLKVCFIFGVIANLVVSAEKRSLNRACIISRSLSRHFVASFSVLALYAVNKNGKSISEKFQKKAFSGSGLRSSGLFMHFWILANSTLAAYIIKRLQGL